MLSGVYHLSPEQVGDMDAGQIGVYMDRLHRVLKLTRPAL